MVTIFKVFQKLIIVVDFVAYGVRSNTTFNSALIQYPLGHT